MLNSTKRLLAELLAICGGPEKLECSRGDGDFGNSNLVCDSSGPRSGGLNLVAWKLCQNNIWIV